MQKTRLAIRQSVLLEKLDIVCLQETKVDVMTDTMMREVYGWRLNQYKALDARGTRGGVVIAWANTKFSMKDVDSRVYSISVLFQNHEDGSEFWFTGVYEPSVRSHRLRRTFFNELVEIKPNNKSWILYGDFNVALSDTDRTNSASDRRGIVAFSRLILDLGLLIIALQGRIYTWSNVRENPSMARLDRFLISMEGNQKFPNSQQQALPNTSSDHCPIAYMARTGFKKSNFFRFENCWLRFQKLNEVVLDSWKMHHNHHTIC